MHVGVSKACLLSVSKTCLLKELFASCLAPKSHMQHRIMYGDIENKVTQMLGKDRPWDQHC